MTDHRYRLRMEITLRDDFGGGALQVSEDVELGRMGFDEMAAILKAFHDLITATREAKTHG